MRTTTQTRLTRKLLSVFMAVAMALSLVGVSGFAYAENVEEADDTNTEVVDPTVTDVEVEGEAITEGDGGEDEEFGGFGGLGSTVDSENGENGESDEEGEEGAGEDDGIMELSLPDGITITGQDNAQPTQQDNNNLLFTGDKTFTMSFADGATFDGTLDVQGKAKLTLEGNGTINGSGKGRSVIIVEGSGSTLTLKGNVTITGGSGTLVHADDSSVVLKKGTTSRTDGNNYRSPWTKDDIYSSGGDYTAGGGILVQRTTEKQGGAGLVVEGGTVTSNTANAGGGIFIDRDCNFSMSAGTVSNNTAHKYEGGGIYVAGHSNGAGGYAALTGGSIIGNKTETSFSWGGGGIFIESKGVLEIGTSLITENTASGLGGGISGCPHAVVGIGRLKEGAAVFGNDASGTSQPSNNALKTLKTEAADGTGGTVYSGDMYAYGVSRSEIIYSDSKNQAGTWSSAQNWAENAKDYYCTKVSYVVGSDLGQPGDDAWKGIVAGAYNPGGYSAQNSYHKEVTIKKDESLTATDETLGLTNLTPAGTKVNGRAVTIKGNTSGTHGGGIGCNGSLIVGKLPSGEAIEPFILEAKKEFKNSEGDALSLKGGEFKFDLIDGNGEVVSYGSNDAEGKITFKVKGADFIDRTIVADEKSAQHTFNLTLRERIPNEKDPNIAYDENPHAVELKITTQCTLTVTDSINMSTYTPLVDSVKYDSQGGQLTITNILNLSAGWNPEADKHYYGDTSDAAQSTFAFTLRGAKDPSTLEASAGLSELVRTGDAGIVDTFYPKVDDGVKPVEIHAKTSAYDGDLSKVVFDQLIYKKESTTTPYWYLLSEDGGADPTVYLMRVDVTVKEKDEVTGSARSLQANVGEVRFAYAFDGADLTVGDFELLDSADEAPVVEFHNMDINRSFAAYGYRVNAASNVALDQQCLVDPKVWKQLEGQPLKGGEFQFRLIEVADYNSTEGINGFEVVARNDEYGMVDFDEAGNVAAPGEDPCCLSFTTPGTRYYRIIEDEDYKRVPYVDYSTEAITFTVDVVRNDAGQLEVASMFYGKLVDGQNVPFEEESKDPTWHPTITNVARGMDLMVQKTSEADRTEGLEGAVYDLYMVSDGEQGDVYMGSGTSDADGWILYEDVNLMTGTPYYFKEKTPPAGHTVDGFRSLYFYLVPDATAENGYAIKYVENLGDMGEEAEDQEQVTGAAAATIKQRAAGDKMLFTYAHDGGVYDAVTSLDFNKLDTRTHEWVEGAQLSVIEKATGQLVSSWTTGKAGHTIARQLDVDVEYILREDQAPAGYDKANEVVFKLDQYGNVQILSGGGDNAEVQESTLTLYDTMFDTENVIYRMNETLREVPGTDGSSLPQTGDDTFGRLLAATLLGVAALCLMTVAALALRRKRKKMQ